MNTSNLFTLDTAIVAGYLLITLVIGLRAGRGIKTMQDYVIGTSGTQRYGTPVLVAAFVATGIGGGSTVGESEKIFKLGLIWVFVALGVMFRQFLVAFYIAPHLGRFDEKLSVGEMMSTFYGKPGQIVTGIAATIRCVGSVGAQAAAIGYLFHYFLGLPQIWGVLIACGIIVVYSSLGGIRSVTATDIVQFAVLVIFIPIISARMLHYAGGWDAVAAGAPVGHFDLLSRDDLRKHILIFLVFLVPNLDPAYTQRLLMARGDIRIAYEASIATGLFRGALVCFVAFISFAVVAVQPNLSPRHAFLYAMDTVLDVGFRGFGIAGLFAVIMSSADSYLHAGGVSLVHDVIRPLRKESLPDDRELALTRGVTFWLGVASVVAAMSFKSIMDLVLAAYSFWLPLVVVPLLAGIVGYFSSTRSFVIAALAGGIATILWKMGLAQTTGVGPALPGLMANLIAFVIARQFDHPGNIYYDPDDPLAQMAKEKMTKRAKEQKNTSINTGVLHEHV